MIGDIEIIKNFVGMVNRWRALLIIVATLVLGFWAVSTSLGSITTRLDSQDAVTEVVLKKFNELEAFGVKHRVESLERSRDKSVEINSKIADRLSNIEGKLTILVERKE